jgi:hypothetical protein
MFKTGHQTAGRKAIAEALNEAPRTALLYEFRRLVQEFFVGALNPPYT